MNSMYYKKKCLMPNIYKRNSILWQWFSLNESSSRQSNKSCFEIYLYIPWKNWILIQALDIFVTHFCKVLSCLIYELFCLCSIQKCSFLVQIQHDWRTLKSWKRVMEASIFLFTNWFLLSWKSRWKLVVQKQGYQTEQLKK